MQRYLLLALIALSALLSSTAHAASWWQPDWAYRKAITLDAGPQGGAVGGDTGRTPVLVRLHTGNFSFDGVSDTGADLRFVAGDDKTVLNHQIEQFDPLLGIALIWVDVPALRANAPQTIWMYYGNPKAPASGNGQLTFDPDYTLVYHFGETGTPPRDTTAYGNHAQTTVAPLDGTVIGKGAQFTGTPLALPASPSLAVQAGGPLTLSMWVRPDQLGPQQVVYARRDALVDAQHAGATDPERPVVAPCAGRKRPESHALREWPRGFDAGRKPASIEYPCNSRRRQQPDTARSGRGCRHGCARRLHRRDR